MKTKCIPVAPHLVVSVGGGDTPPSLVNRMTNACENITLPQTSFAGGKETTSRTTKVHATFIIL